MIERIRPNPHPETLAYAAEVALVAAEDLRRKAFEQAALLQAVEAKEKLDQYGTASDVTEFDRQTEQDIGGFYEKTGVRLLGEEGTATWPEAKVPTLDVHVDPIDGTTLFINYMQKLVAWRRLPENERPLQPTCGSMVSLGGLRPGSHVPEWGVVAAPFLSPAGVVRWVVGPGTPPMRIEPDGSQHELPHASLRASPEPGGTVLVCSNSSERQFRWPLQAAGFEVARYESSVAVALSIMDPELPARILPEHKPDAPPVGVVLSSAKNWDVAATAALARRLGHFFGDIRGGLRMFEPGATSAIFAVQEKFGREIVRLVAPAL